MEAFNACAPSPDDARNARLLSALIKGSIKVLGHDADLDQLSAAQELTTEGFAAFSSLNPPRWLRLSVIGTLLIGSFLPMILATYQAYQGSKKEEDNGFS